MNFAEAMKTEGNFTRTENGAVALKSTGTACLDLFSTIGSLRGQDKVRIETLFEEAYKEDPLLATKIVFYGRDIRGGLGEREIFKTLLNYMAIYHSESVYPNIHLIGEYGRFDDLYCLMGTPVEEQMWIYMKNQLVEDYEAMISGRKVSLLAKWIKTADASSEKTRKLGILTAQKLGYSVYSFKRMIRELRAHLRIVETQMSNNEWNQIEYEHVPSRASMIYRKAFDRHDHERYADFINKANKGEVKINSSTLYPYDLIEKIWGWGEINHDDTVEAQWKQLPNYLDGKNNVIVIADTSGSMCGRPMNTAIGLAIYFAERNSGPYHNLWMNFSSNPSYQILKGETLEQKLRSIDYRNWNNSTNLKAAFEMILDTAINNNISSEEMPKAIVVISDMEIDYCGDRSWSFYDKMRNMYAKKGYAIPNIIFWNVQSRHDIFHADSKRKGVQLFSGQSASTFKNVLQCIGMTPVEAMMKVIDSERYDPIVVVKEWSSV